MNAYDRKQWLINHGEFGNVRGQRYGRYQLSWVPKRGRLVLSSEGYSVNEAKLKMFDKAKRALFARCVEHEPA